MFQTDYNQYVGPQLLKSCTVLFTILCRSSLKATSCRGLFSCTLNVTSVLNLWVIRFSHFSNAKMQGFGTLTNSTVQVPLLKSFSVWEIL